MSLIKQIMSHNGYRHLEIMSRDRRVSKSKTRRRVTRGVVVHCEMMKLAAEIGLFDTEDPAYRTHVPWQQAAMRKSNSMEMLY
jgi:hypothetical protein